MINKLENKGFNTKWNVLYRELISKNLKFDQNKKT